MTKFTVVVGETEVVVEADMYSVDDRLTFYIKPMGGGRKTTAVFNSWKYVLIDE